MKLAIFSNIQSNVEALKKFLEQTVDKNIDAYINLGDSFYGDFEPKKTYDLIRQSSFINLMGNEDRMILEASLDQLESNEKLKKVYYDLGEEVLYFIQDLQFEKIIGQDFYMVHGTYFDDSECLIEEEIDGQIVLRDEKKIIELLDDIKAQFIFCANSEIPRCITLQTTGQIIINPGKLGSDAGNYMILTIEDGKYGVELGTVKE